jgi:hypothetical protein
LAWLSRAFPADAGNLIFRKSVAEFLTSGAPNNQENGSVNSRPFHPKLVNLIGQILNVFGQIYVQKVNVAWMYEFGELTLTPNEFLPVFLCGEYPTDLYRPIDHDNKLAPTIK